MSADLNPRNWSLRAAAMIWQTTGKAPQTSLSSSHHKKSFWTGPLATTDPQHCKTPSAASVSASLPTPLAEPRAHQRGLAGLRYDKPWQATPYGQTLSYAQYKCSSITLHVNMYVWNYGYNLIPCVDITRNPIYDYLWLSTNIYAYLCLPTIIYNYLRLSTIL